MKLYLSIIFLAVHCHVGLSQVNAYPPIGTKTLYISRDSAHVFEIVDVGKYVNYSRPLQGQVIGQLALGSNFVVVTDDYTNGYDNDDNHAYAFVSKRVGDAWIPPQPISGALHEIYESGGNILVLTNSYAYAFAPDNANNYNWYGPPQPIQNNGFHKVIGFNGNFVIVTKGADNYAYAFVPIPQSQNKFSWVAPQKIQGDFLDVIASDGKFGVITNGWFYELSKRLNYTWAPPITIKKLK